MGDCLPMVLSEAGAAGMALVSTDVGAIREIVRDGETGILIPPGDLDALVDALRRLIGDAGKCRRMGAAAAALVRSKFDALHNAAPDRRPAPQYCRSRRTSVISVNSIASPAESENRRKVLLFTNSVAVGGLEEHVRLIAKELDRTHFVVHCVFPDWEPTNEFTRSVGEVADHLSFVTPDRRYGVVRQLQETVRFWRLLRTNHIDVVHLHATSYHGSVVALACARLARVPRVFLTEHLAPEHAPSRLGRTKRNVFTRFLTGLVCVSQKNRVARARYLREPPGKVHVINNGIDVSRFDAPDLQGRADEVRGELALPADARVVGSAIRLEPGKGVEDLVAAFAIVSAAYPSAVLMIVGDGTSRPTLETQATEHGIADHVRFLGFKPDPRPYILNMDVFVLPVPFGSASIGLLEAMAMRRPCVITFGGEGEAVVPGENGFWAEPRTPSSIAEHVGTLLADDEMRQRFGQERAPPGGTRLLRGSRRTFARSSLRGITIRITRGNRMTRRYRIGFMMDQVAGHVTTYHNLRAITERDPDIEAWWGEVTYYREGGGIERLGERVARFVPTYVTGVSPGGDRTASPHFARPRSMRFSRTRRSRCSRRVACHRSSRSSISTRRRSFWTTLAEYTPKPDPKALAAVKYRLMRRLFEQACRSTRHGGNGRTTRS